MIDDVLLVDAIRLILCVAALLLAAMVLRLAWVRHKRSGFEAFESNHPLTYVSYALALGLMAALRISHIGEPPTWDLWVAMTVVTLGWIGVARRAHITAPPLRR